jgi:hypothetical protein
MNTETVCRICSSWKLSQRHQCPPAFHCRRQGGKTWIRVHGSSASEAAETFSDREPNFFLSTREFMVEVKPDGAGDDELQVFMMAPVVRVDHVAMEIS